MGEQGGLGTPGGAGGEDDLSRILGMDGSRGPLVFLRDGAGKVLGEPLEGEGPVEGLLRRGKLDQVLDGGALPLHGKPQLTEVSRRRRSQERESPGLDLLADSG